MSDANATASTTTSSAVAVVFPGQGAQHVGMGAGLAEAVPAARDLFERAGEILGYDLARLCADGPLEELTRTEIAQPAIFTVSMAALELLRARRPEIIERASLTAGLSLGEFTALVFAGALNFEDGLRLVQHRGRWMQEACDARRGTMASVLGMSEEQVREVCLAAARAGVVGVANVNDPRQMVISGDVEAVRLAADKAREAGARKVVELTVAGAFHSELMRPAQERLAKMIGETPVRDPRIPVVSNATGAPVRSAKEIRANLVRQLTSPVLWVSSVRAMIDAGVREFWELGPGKVLVSLVRRIDRDTTRHTVGGPADLEENQDWTR